MKPPPSSMSANSFELNMNQDRRLLVFLFNLLLGVGVKLLVLKLERSALCPVLFELTRPLLL
jgi:hypothetical protein